jgi:hypothetical protein
MSDQTWAQQTPAALQMIRQALGQKSGGASRTRKRSKARSPKKRKRTARASGAKRSAGGRKKARLVKGSAAAKRYMASIRKKRR